MTSFRPAPGRPIVFTGATVHPTPARRVRADLAVDGATLVDGSPSDEAQVVDVAGASIVPLRIDSLSSARGGGAQDTSDLVAGNAATFAITRGRVAESQLHGMLIIDPRDLVAVMFDGKLMAWEGEPTAEAARERGSDTWVGAWHDSGHDMTQYLRADGRYSETRSGRVDAWTGRYWTSGAHIAYLDDTGFWAFGEQHQDVLYHAYFVLTR